MNIIRFSGLSPVTVTQNYLICAVCTVPIFVDDELTAAADLSNSGTEDPFMNKSHSFENKSRHLLQRYGLAVLRQCWFVVFIFLYSLWV